MKISELIGSLEKRLANYGDLDVQVTWEGIKNFIDDSNIYKAKDGRLYIDADDNFYKDEFEDK